MRQQPHDSDADVAAGPPSKRRRVPPPGKARPRPGAGRASRPQQQQLSSEGEECKDEEAEEAAGAAPEQQQQQLGCSRHTDPHRPATGRLHLDVDPEWMLRWQQAGVAQLAHEAPPEAIKCAAAELAVRLEEERQQRQGAVHAGVAKVRGGRVGSAGGRARGAGGAQHPMLGRSTPCDGLCDQAG